MSRIANMLTMHNLRERGVEVPEDLDPGICFFSCCLKQMLCTTGVYDWKKERDYFLEYWTSLACKFNDTIPTLATTYESLADGVDGLINGGELPELIKSQDAVAEADIIKAEMDALDQEDYDSDEQYQVSKTDRGKDVLAPEQNIDTQKELLDILAELKSAIPKESSPKSKYMAKKMLDA